MENEPRPFGQMILPISLLTTLFFFNFIIRLIPSPLMPTIMTEMSLTSDQAGSFFLFLAAGHFISTICSGFVSAFLKHKKTLLLSVVCTGIFSIGVGLAQNYTTILSCLFAMGLATGLYLPSGMSVLTGSIARQNWGKAIGIHEMAPNISFLVAPVLCELFLLWGPWRSVFITAGGLAIFFALVFYFFADVADFKGEAPTLSSLLPLAATPSFWIMIVIFTVGVIGTMGVYYMMPLYLVQEHGMLQAEANTLVSLSRVLTIPVTLSAGWAVDRIGIKRALTGQLILTGCFTILISLLDGRVMQGVILIQPLLAQAFFPPAFAAIARIGSKKTRNIILSFLLPIAFLIGGGVMPKFMGIMGAAGRFSLGFTLCGVLLMACAFLPATLKLSDE